MRDPIPSRAPALSLARRVISRRAVVERRRWLAGWAIGVAGLIVVTVAFWPTLRGRSQELNDAMKNMPESLKALFGLGGDVDMFSPVGYLSSKVFAMTLPLLLLVAGIGLGAAPAGEEEHGLLEATFALPLRRRDVVAGRWRAAASLLLALVLVALVTSVVSAEAVGVDVSITGLVWACVAAAALALVHAGLAAVVGAWTGRRSLAVAVASVVAVVGYLVTSLADAGIGVFEAVRPASPFTHYDVVHVMVVGYPSWHLIVLAVPLAVVEPLLARSIDLRDLRAG